MSAAKKFSVRQSIEPEPSPNLDEAPQPLRFFLLKYLQGKYVGYPAQAGEILERFLRRPGLRNEFHNLHDPSLWKRMYSYIEGFKWWEVYDFAEAVFHIVASNNHCEGDGFQAELNKVLAENNIPYLMVGVEIVYRGSDSSEIAVSDAKELLAAQRRQTPEDEDN